MILKTLILYTFYALILLSGAAILGVTLTEHGNQYGEVIGKGSNISLSVFGVILVLFALLGCYGLYKMSSCIMTTCIVILIIIAIIQVVLGIIILDRFSEKEFVESTIEPILKDIYKQSKDNKEGRELVDRIQVNYECCGYKSSWDPEVNEGLTLIRSCCNVTVKICTHISAYKDNCTSKLSKAVTTKSRTIGGILITFAGIEVAASIVLCCILKFIPL